MESFAHALRQLPTIIAENGGYDSSQLVSELRAAHKEGRKTMGLGMYLVDRATRLGDLAIVNSGHFFENDRITRDL
jgi:hypothetical protein